MAEKLKVIVCQHGSRRRYAVARMLEKSDSLVSLYTDSYSNSPLGILSSYLSKFLNIPSLNRLSNRKVIGIPKNKIKHCDYLHIVELFQKLLKINKNGFELYQQRNRILSKEMISWGVNGTNVVYTMFRENIDFLKWTKGNNVKLAVDVFISPITHDILIEETKKLPSWKTDEDLNNSHLLKENWETVADLADILICPSQWVADGVRACTPSAYHKVRVVPYGCSIDYKGLTNNPIKGRVFFAGGDALRKGLYYLAVATTSLKNKGLDLDVRVAGSLPSNVVNDPVCRDLNFLGKLNKSEMEEEFLTAEVFTLPSLSEGFAGVVAESIAAGCPVVVTHEAGTPVINGKEGIIVEARNSHSLEMGLFKMLTDTDFRNKCASNCIKNFDFYSEQRWNDRLIHVLQGLVFK